jgi:nitrogen PTS system EIIA component
MPTSLSHGIGVPHTRDFLLNTHFDVITVVYPEQPIEYGALDGQLVHTLFFLFACEDKRHLHLLAKLAHLTSNEKACAFLRTKPSKERLLEFMKHWESSLNPH